MKLTKGQIEDKIMQAQTTMVMHQPFFGLLSFNLEMVVDDTIRPATACTDGKRMWFHPDFVESLTPPQLIGLVAHEVLHCAIGTIWRRGHRDPEKWGAAEDYVINLMVEAAGNMQLPPGGLISKMYEGLSGEEVYEKLPDDAVSKLPKGWNIGGFKEGEEGPGQQAEEKELEVKWSTAVIQAAAVAKARGQLPAGLEKFVGELTKATVNWKEVLWRFISAHSASDYSFRRPSRRGMIVGAYLPTLYSERVGEVVEAFDTSGSTSSLLTQFASEERAIMGQVRPEKVWRMYCDAKVQRVEEVEAGSAEPIKSFPGGGGTDFRPIFEEVAKRGIEPVCLVFLTDLEGTFPDKEPPYPVLWVTPGKGVAPWGETVRMTA